MRPNQDSLIFTKEWKTGRSLAGVCYGGQWLETTRGVKILVWVEKSSKKTSWGGRALVAKFPLRNRREMLTFWRNYRKVLVTRVQLTQWGASHSTHFHAPRQNLHYHSQRVCHLLGEKDQFNSAKCIQKWIWSFFNCLFRHKSNAAQLLVEARVQPTSSKHVSMLFWSLPLAEVPPSHLVGGVRYQWACPISTLCRLKVLHPQ